MIFKQAADMIANVHEQKLSDKAGRGLRVVIVEDSEDSLEMLQLFLQHLGHKTFAAETGPQGVAAILQHKPQVALVDLGLPGLSGLELARLIRSHPEAGGVYLVALTGYGRTEDREATRRAGFDEHIIKPVSSDTLERVLAAGRRANEHRRSVLRSTSLG